MYKLFSNVVPRALLRLGESVLSSAEKNPDNEVEYSHFFIEQLRIKDSANEAYSKRVGKKKKIIKNRSYERDSNRASAEMHLS